ncbi:MAG: hypothetical protein NTY64_18670, partial [Deltaproteobacteria bacterium]|nr:hypothetical protein [Deltaproteobacteria bacterium]
MEKKIIFAGTLLILWTLFPSSPCFSQEDRIVQTAIETVKAQEHLPQGTEVKFLEKGKSPISDFYSVKL